MKRVSSLVMKSTFFCIDRSVFSAYFSSPDPSEVVAGIDTTLMSVY